MARKNSNAGQPNRVAQMRRRSERVYRNGMYKDARRMVLGPGSDNLSTQKKNEELIARDTPMVLELVS